MEREIPNRWQARFKKDAGRGSRQVESEVLYRWKAMLKTGADRGSRQVESEVPDRWKARSIKTSGKRGPIQVES